MPVTVAPLSERSLGDLKGRIADELARSDLTSQIALAITQAIEEACADHFWFMDTVDVSVPLSAAQTAYTGTAIENLLSIDRVRLFIGALQITLPQANDDIRSRLTDGTPPQGQPALWSRNGDTLYVWPSPTQSYSLMIDGVSKGATLSSDGDSNIWTDSAKGEPLVRALAKRQLYADVIQNMDKALAQDKLAERYRDQLLALTAGRLATDELVAFGV